MIRFFLGFALGALAVIIWQHRELLSDAYKNRNKIAGAGKVFDGLDDLGVTDKVKEWF